ncbi:MAG: hypothetical protein CL855_00295 [Cryomorphaceae bacterium]|nr:hypothetical protein [Cryomorphaceae bacterium]
MKIKTLTSLVFCSFISIGFCQDILGIDVSNWQGNIDWEQVKADGYTFAWAKSTEGMTYTDPMFLTNMENGLDANVVMGAYHFARPDNNTPQEDAANFLNIASAYIGNGFLPPVLDLENPYSGGQAVLLTDMFTSEELSNWAQAWMTEVETQTGISPFIYINGNYANYLNSSLTEYSLWFAQPDENLSPPVNIGNWEDWKFKQYSWWGDILGIQGDVDLNIFNGTLQDFNTIIGINTAEIAVQNSHIYVFPNPTSGLLHIDADGNQIEEATLYDCKGLIQPALFKDGFVDCSVLSPGLYYLHITTIKGLYYFLKVNKI